MKLRIDKINKQHGGYIYLKIDFAPGEKKHTETTVNFNITNRQNYADIACKLMEETGSNVFVQRKDTQVAAPLFSGSIYKNLQEYSLAVSLVDAEKFLAHCVKEDYLSAEEKQKCDETIKEYTKPEPSYYRSAGPGRM